MDVMSGTRWKLLLSALAVSLLAVPSARAIDSKSCLTCHQYRGLARIGDDGKTISHYYVDPAYYTRGLGPHARLQCTDCHDFSEVQPFPHKPVSPVNCSKECHLDDAGKVERVFSHGRVEAMLKKSVHGPEVMKKSNELLGGPLRAGEKSQATCLLCHDEPRFNKSVTGLAQQDAPIGRCKTCHDETLPLPINPQYAYWHVHARSQPARNHEDVVKVCGLCHNNTAIQREFKLSDAVVSYLASFHGKATLLGSQETAGCLECHVGPLQNVHVMLARKDASASTNPKNVGDTCRSVACHPTAGKEISSAAIHLSLAAGGAEYIIACIFVVLIVVTFGPSLALCALKLLQIVVDRKDPEHEHHVGVVKKLMDTHEGRRKLMRFNLHQRFQHWVLVVCFSTLVVTGFPIKFADRAWAAWVIGRLGGLPAARLLHHWTGAILIAGMIYHMGYITLGIIKTRRKTGKSLWRVAWGLPMLPRPQDGKEMLDLLLYASFIKRKRPEGDRFNAEEKFEYIGVFWGTIVLGVTGALMWANAWTSRHTAGRVLTVASLVHTFEAFLALLHVGIVHMASVIFSPGVFPVSRAMFTGNTPAEEIVEGHGAMLAEAAKEMGVAGEAHHG
jgi:cytochrome b subunit of formate dehydrogenase